jgi:hypothetical protein
MSDLFHCFDNSDVIITSYFTSKADPQNPNVHAPNNTISYIYNWYISTLYLDLNAIIIHDQLSDEFILQYERPNIKFYQHTPGRFSLNDERFIALNNLIKSNNFAKVLITDGNDVTIKKNPFEFITNPNMLYFGSDESAYPTIKDNSWCMHKLSQFIKDANGTLHMDRSILDFEYVNAGVIGGAAELMGAFTESISEIFNKLGTNNNHNMIATNYLLWLTSIAHHKGAPLTSNFKKYELASDNFIVHK